MGCPAPGGGWSSGLDGGDDDPAFAVTVEHTIGRLRTYQALHQTNRHHRQNHTQRVRAIAGLVNRCLAA